MGISTKQENQELFERPKLMVNHSSNEVFVIKQVFPHGALGRMLLNSAYNIEEAEGHIFEQMALGDQETIIGRTFSSLFPAKEKMRINHFFKSSSTTHIAMLSELQFSKGKKDINWVTAYCKQEKLEEGEMSYNVVFLDCEDSFATLTTDRFDTLYRSFYDMYEAELAQVGLSLRDDIAQELYALRVSLQSFILSYGYENEIAVLKKQLNGTIKKVSDLSNDLLPNVFIHMGFLPAMEDMVFAVKRLGYDLRYKIDPRMKDKSPEFQFCCYRVVQALLQSWKVNTSPYEASLLILVKGNKININLSESRSNPDSGIHYYSEALLHNVRNRIALYDGALEVDRMLDNSQLRITMYN